MRVLSLLMVMLSVILLPPAIYGQSKTLDIIYTGSMSGELEPCGCSPKTDFGGVARISGYLAGHNKDLAPYMLVDAGNFTDKNTPQGRMKAKAMLQSFVIMKYDAVAFMKKEKGFPEDLFSPIIKEYKIPVISSMPLYEQSVSVNRDKFKINVSVDPENYQEGRLNILLTDLSVRESGLIKGWDVIIVSSGEILDKPLTVNKTIIATGYPKGKKLGILTLQIGNGGEIKNYEHRWQLLGSDIEEDAKIRNVLNNYDSKVAGLLRESEKPPEGTSYLGAAKCAECHQLFEESWKKTLHASAFSSLKQAGKSADPECIVCHTVGFGEQGGFQSIETTPGLANVQCEECHGLDREHIDDFSRPMKPVTKAVCLKCHTKDNSPDFDYPVYLEKIKH